MSCAAGWDTQLVVATKDTSAEGFAGFRGDFKVEGASPEKDRAGLDRDHADCSQRRGSGLFGDQPCTTPTQDAQPDVNIGLKGSCNAKASWCEQPWFHPSAEGLRPWQ